MMMAHQSTRSNLQIDLEEDFPNQIQFPMLRDSMSMDKASLLPNSSSSLISTSITSSSTSSANSSSDDYSLEDYHISPMSTSEKCTQFANMILYSRFYIAMFFVMIMINLFIIVWDLKSPTGYPMEWWFILLETIVSSAIIFEVVIRMISQGKRYWLNLWNIFDVVVSFLCIVALSSYLLGPSHILELNQMVVTCLIIFRSCLQFCRLFFILKQQRQLLDQRRNRIDFSQVDIQEIELVD